MTSLIDETGVQSQMSGDTMFQGSPIVIQTEHHEIHCGDSYEATYNFSIPNVSTLNLLIVVPDEDGTGQSQKLYHMLMAIEAEAEVSVQLFEGSDSEAGTSISSFNRNRNSTNDDVLGISYAPTITTDGDSIWGPWRVGSGRTVVGSFSRAREIVLKNNTIYLLRLINQETTGNNVNIGFDYYVHPGV